MCNAAAARAPIVAALTLALALTLTLTLALTLALTNAAAMGAREQLQLVCAHRVLVGVHGQGMEWGHLLNAGHTDGAALIEFSAGR